MQLQPFLSSSFVSAVLHALNAIFLPPKAFDYLLLAAVIVFQTVQHDVLHG
jgi:hypothetical protein